jgi:hypothetical protein
VADTARERARKKKLAQGPTRSAFDKDEEDIARAAARAKRDAAVNNDATRKKKPTSTQHLPTPRTPRKKILDRIT